MLWHFPPIFSIMLALTHVTDEEGDEAWEGVVEEGAGDTYYTGEEGLENLTPQGRATLQHLENILRNPGDGNTGSTQSAQPATEMSNGGEDQCCRKDQS